MSGRRPRSLSSPGRMPGNWIPIIILGPKVRPFVMPRIVKMPQSLTQIWIHVVFSTKSRRPFLKNVTFRKEMFRMLAHHVKESGCISASVGGHIDHVHLLVGLSRTITISKLMEKIKIETSKWAKSCEDGSTTFSWQAGYGAFSVSHSKCQEVDRYIRSQDDHHAEHSFQDEFRRLCELHGIEIDERYVWD